MNDKHKVTRIRHELRRRHVTVKLVERLTPRMVRVTFSGDSLDGFASDGHDDHVKLIFPRIAQALPESDVRPIMRDYTPRRYDAAKQELVIDFALHETGPATSWAAQSRPGQQLEIGGPKGSFVVSDDFDWYLLVGDESALPAIGRRLEELRPDARAIVVAGVVDRAEEMQFRSSATFEVHWVHRPASKAADPSLLLATVENLTLPDGDGYAWVAGEGEMAKAVRDHLLTERGLNKAWVKAAGYWRQDRVAVHEPLND